MKDITLVNHLRGLSVPGQSKAPAAVQGEGFEDTLRQVVGEVNRLLVESDRAVEKVQTGESKNLHEVMISMEKADISLRLFTQVRNKVVDAYQEIMRMQV